MRALTIPGTPYLPILPYFAETVNALLLELPAVREARESSLAGRSDDAEVQRLLAVVVVPVRSVGRGDVDVVRAGQERERVHCEAHDALFAQRHRHVVQHRVRAVDAGAVVAVDVDAEHRVGQPGLVAVADLERRGVADLEERLRRATSIDDLRGHDLDLAGAGAAADLATQRALAELALADLEGVGGRDVAHRAARGNTSLIEPDRAVAQALDEADVVRR